MAILKRRDAAGNKFGSYRISIYLGKDEDGKKLCHWETFDGNIQQARERETQIKYEIKHGQYFKPSKLTVSTFLDRWIDDYSRPNLSPNVTAGYEFIIRKYIKPHLGKFALTALVKPQIAQYYSDRVNGGLKAQTVVHHHTLLHKAFETAIEWGLLQYNPSDGLHPPTVEKVEMETLSPGEVKAYLEAAKQTEYYALFFTDLYTGLRRSELLALRWKDVDLKSGRITINRAMHMLAEGQVLFRQTKTNKSRRSIPLTKSNLKVLKDHLKFCKKNEKKGAIEITPDTLVFCHLDSGEPYRPDTISHVFPRIARIAGLKHVRLHDARHTHATILLAQDVNPKIVQERLGHAQFSTTMDIYSHVIPSMQRKAAESFDAAFKAPYNTRVKKK